MHPSETLLGPQEALILAQFLAEHGSSKKPPLKPSQGINACAGILEHGKEAAHPLSKVLLWLSFQREPNKKKHRKCQPPKGVLPLLLPLIWGAFLQTGVTQQKQGSCSFSGPFRAFDSLGCKPQLFGTYFTAVLGTVKSGRSQNDHWRWGAERGMLAGLQELKMPAKRKRRELP